MRLKVFAFQLLVSLFCVLCFNEFLIYYVTLFWQCDWPKRLDQQNGLVKAMILADPHLLGPFRGHWFDKLRREWQMHRAFQTAVTLFKPDVIFILGDIFDEGKWVNDEQYNTYLNRYFQIFNLDGQNTQMYSIVGNHDIGFHYSAHPYLVERFYKTMNTSGVQLITVKNVHFVTINSVAMEGDGCTLCEQAERQLIYVSYQLQCARGEGNCDKIPKIGKYSAPVILQHYPFYRISDKGCIEGDAPEIERFREGWEVLSQDSTNLVSKLLKPRVAFSGHSHHYCHVKNERLNADEYTLASFSWRNKDNPSFLLTYFTEDDYEVSKCDMPKESTVYKFYIVLSVFCLLFPFLRVRLLFKNLKKFCIRKNFTKNKDKR